MADGLFDNRYRYDYIYPRGRSGETLRALDTQQNERPVVIKRPAPNDAPPIRAGQEVSILKERQALTRLAGHDVLTEFLGSGQFFVGGMPHQYIVMERAEGVMVAEMVLELARNGERMPMLEMLVIVDHLLDLLQLAHARDIVYNDVDAKHLFWSREDYRLKVIDWGNAVFLEGDEVTPQGVSRQSDIYQVGELLYFILTGGKRAEVPRDANAAFQLDFGENGERVSPRLQSIISKALHPNTRQRYQDINQLRRELTEFRAPYDRDRSAVVNRVAERLRHNLSKEDLRGLLETLEPALAADPGYPPARRAHGEINDRLRDLNVSADLDAVRIYMEGGNWSRAADLLHELRDNAGPQTTVTVELLLDTCLLVLDSGIEETPSGLLDAITLIFEGGGMEAAICLLTEEPPDDEALRLQWLLAERISAHMPEVQLLRPNLYRLELALGGLAVDGINISDARALLEEIQAMLDGLASESRADLPEMRDAYRGLVERLTTLNKLLATVVVQRRLPNRKLPLTSLDRALNAAMALTDNMHVIGKQAATSPRDAQAALDSSRLIDPNSQLWGAVGRLLDNLYELLQSYQVYIPAADGSDLEAWFIGARKDLTPFCERLFDPLLNNMVAGLEEAGRCWGRYMTAVVQGNRAAAAAELTRAAEAIAMVSPTLSGWLNQLRSVIEGSHYIERHAVYGGLGRALADGWEHFDRGRLPDAERLAQQAFEIARTEAERDAAQRLLKLSGTARDWVERGGINNEERTRQVLSAIEGLLTPEERAINENFASQMPSRETYLRAMNRGLIELYAQRSTAAVRLYYFWCVLLGALEAHEASLEDARFWREAAVRALGDHGPRHAATRALEEFIERRRDLNDAAERINRIVGSDSLTILERTRRHIEDNNQARLLAAGIQSLRELEAALREWADGEFRAAGLKLENALKGVTEVEQTAGIKLTAYRGWLDELQASAAELHNLARQMRQIIDRRPAEPADIVLEAHRRQAETTTRLLGERNAAQINQWCQTYEAFLEAYTDHSVRRSVRLSRFNELFRAMFIDRHPAYPLFRHWYDLTDKAPEFPAPPTDDPTPRIDEEEIVEEDEYTGSKYVAQQEDTQPTTRRRLPLGGVVILVALVAVIAALVILFGGDDDSGTGLAVTNGTSTEAPDETAAALAVVDDPESTEEPDAGDEIAAVPFDPDSLVTPTLVTPTTPTSPPPTETPPEPTDTPVLPSATPAPPTATFTPTQTYTPTSTPTPTLPPQGMQGWQDLLPLFDRMEELPWSVEQFAPVAGGNTWRLGVGGTTPDEELVITLPGDTLDLYYGNNAPARIRRADATLSLTTYDPALLDADEVYFGLMLRSLEDEGEQVGLYVQVVNLNTLNLWLRQGDDLEFISQRSVNSVIARIRLERDPVNGNVTVFLNDAQVGSGLSFVDADDPVQPALFVKDGGVIVSVTNWRIGLR